MSTHAIYAIRHIATGRFYLGRAVDYVARWRVHLHHLRHGKHHSGKLQNAWNKYGEDAFIFEIVHLVNEEHELIGWEQYWLDTLNPFYNVSKGAEGPTGYKHTPEARAKMSETQKGKPKNLSAEERHVRRTRQAGVPRSATTKARISAARMGHDVSETTRDKMSKARAGRAWSDIDRAARCSHIFMDPLGRSYVTQSIVGFSHEFNISKDALRSLAKGQLSEYKGWTYVGLVAPANAMQSSCLVSTDRAVSPPRAGQKHDQMMDVPP